MARPVSALGGAVAFGQRVQRARAPSSSAWPWARRWCSALSSSHSSRRAPACPARRSARPGVHARAPACHAGSRAPAPARPRPCARPARRHHGGGVDAGLAVEQGAHGGRPGEALPGMLAVDVDQVVGRLAQLGHVAGLPLIQARLLPCASTVRRSSRCPGRPGSRPRPARAASVGGLSNSALTSARVAPSRTTPASAAAAQRQLQRVDQDGLAGAGLAGQHGEAGRTRAPARAR
jgi:hypothetical protein